MKKLISIVALIATTYASAETYTKSLDNAGWHMVGVPINSVTIDDTTFDANANVVWKWNGKTQAWEFYSKNATLVGIAQSINVPIISTLNKGDAIWVKNSATTTVNFANSLTSNTTGCTEEPQEVDTRVVKVGSSGQELSDESTGWSAIWYKDPGLNIMLAFERTPATFLSTKTQPEAKTYCDNMTFIGFDNWRLPTREESIVMSYYYTKNAAKIKNTTANKLWTSSVSSCCYDYYYYYYHQNNSALADDGDYKYQFQCVRTVQ